MDLLKEIDLMIAQAPITKGAFATIYKKALSFLIFQSWILQTNDRAVNGFQYFGKESSFSSSVCSTNTLAKEKPDVKQQNRFILILYFEELEPREERRKNHILTLARSGRSS